MNRPPWRDDAACVDVDTGLFFPPTDDPNSPLWNPARAVCATCPVADECLDEALAHREGYGLRAGLTPSERTNLIRRLRRQELKRAG